MKGNNLRFVLVVCGLVAVVMLVVAFSHAQETKAPAAPAKQAAPMPPDPLTLDASEAGEVKKLQTAFGVIAEELATAEQQVRVLTGLRDRKMQEYREFLVRSTRRRNLDPAGYLVDVDGGKLVAVPAAAGKGGGR